MIIVIVDRVKMPKNCEMCPYIQIEEQPLGYPDYVHCPVIPRDFGSKENWDEQRPEDCPLLEVHGVVE